MVLAVENTPVDKVKDNLLLVLLHTLMRRASLTQKRGALRIPPVAPPVETAGSGPALIWTKLLLTNIGEYGLSRNKGTGAVLRRSPPSEFIH